MRSTSIVIDQAAANGGGGTCGGSDTTLLDAAGSEASKAVAVLVKVQALLGCSTDEVILFCSRKVALSGRHSKLIPGKSSFTAVDVILAWTEYSLPGL